MTPAAEVARDCIALMAALDADEDVPFDLPAAAPELRRMLICCAALANTALWGIASRDGESVVAVRERLSLAFVEVGG
jgi:hypothetical protein